MKKILKRYAAAFSLTEAMVMIIITGVLIIAAFPLVNISKQFKDYDLATVNCVRSESAASFSSTACSNTINAARYNQGKALKTLIFLADHGKSTTEQEAARKVLRQVCDLSGDKACQYFADTCKKDSSGCDITGSDYDLRYYLALFTNDTNNGRIFLSDFLQGYYNLGYKNIVTEVDTVCCNPDFNTACVVKGFTVCPLKDARFIGMTSSNNFGRSVSSAGDVNGDGIDDILIGADQADTSYNNAGEAYLILGRNDDNWRNLIGSGTVYLNQTLSWANSTVRFIGRASTNNTGRSVSSAGDVNGDGIDDILIGAGFASGGGTSSGETYLIMGRTNADWNTLTGGTGDFSLTNVSWANRSVRFIGRVTYDYAGFAVSSAGDVDKDGNDDILIGAYGADGGGSYSGETYLIMGRTDDDWNALTGGTGLFNLDNLSWDNKTIRFIGFTNTDTSGRAVGAAGDVNNDTYDDFIIGADESDTGGALAGDAYLIFGRTFANWTTLAGTGDVYLNQTLSWSNSMVRFIGREADDSLGYSVGSAGDINNDGIPDVLLGAYDANGGGGDSGETYVILGRSTTDWGTLAGAGDFNLDNLSWANGTLRFYGRIPDDESGRSVRSAGDVNGDGYDDIITGAHFGNGGGADSGEAYLIFGRSNADWSTLTGGTGNFNLDYLSWANRTIMFIGRITLDYFGESVGSAGDINNDGYDDILIGAMQADGAGDLSGETYLIWGRNNADWSRITGGTVYCNATWP